MTPDPQQTLVEQAGEEAPRCVRCDQLMPEGTCDCVPAYEIAPFGSGYIVTTPDTPDAPRATALALSFGGRWVPAYKGYALLPSKAAQFEQFFAAGAAAVRAYRAGPIWRYTFPGSRRPCNVYVATKRIKRGTVA